MMFRRSTDTDLFTQACAVALGTVFIFAGVVKLTLSPPVVARLADWGYANWLIDLIGIAEIIGGALILIPPTAFLGASALAGLVVGMGYMHWVNSSGIEVLPFTAFLVLLGVVIWQRRPGPRWMRRSINGRIRYAQHPLRTLR
jgi:uncharacterized membrane protein YphA (DoxX/SURF4 family)